MSLVVQLYLESYLLNRSHVPDLLTWQCFSSKQLEQHVSIKQEKLINLVFLFLRLEFKKNSFVSLSMSPMDLSDGQIGSRAH